MRRKKSEGLSISTIVVLVLILFLMWSAINNPATTSFVLFIFFIALVILIVKKLLPTLLQTNKFKNLNLDQVDIMPGKTFEHYVAELLTYRGFRTEVTRGSGDFGVDIVAQNGNTRYAVQCKRYSKNISRTAVSDAVAGVRSYNCQVPIVVTNRYFTKGAKELAQVNKCILIDRDTLAEWINDYREKRPVHKLLK